MRTERESTVEGNTKKSRVRVKRQKRRVNKKRGAKRNIKRRKREKRRGTFRGIKPQQPTLRPFRHSVEGLLDLSISH
jgi:hypothetical protein